MGIVTDGMDRTKMDGTDRISGNGQIQDTNGNGADGQMETLNPCIYKEMGEVTNIKGCIS